MCATHLFSVFATFAATALMVWATKRKQQSCKEIYGNEKCVTYACMHVHIAPVDMHLLLRFGLESLLAQCTAEICHLRRSLLLPLVVMSDINCKYCSTLTVLCSTASPSPSEFFSLSRRYYYSMEIHCVVYLSSFGCCLVFDSNQGGTNQLHQLFYLPKQPQPLNRKREFIFFLRIFERQRHSMRNKFDSFVVLPLEMTLPVV